MAYPLLMTKLHLPPAGPNMVARPRLIAKLEESLRRPLTLVSAPAGFGKTTLVSEWRAAPEGRARPLAYVSLDSGDNNAGRFWAYIAGALRTLPELAALPEELEADAPPELLLTPLVNGLKAADPVILVLDDYHVIETQAIHDAIEYLVERMPAGLRLLLLTRSDPPWPLARLRAHGSMSELRAADLRFQPDEAAVFLTGAMGLDLPAGDIAALEQRTEGWIVALRMAAISLDGHANPHEFITRFSGDNRYIADYLAEEALAKQPEALRSFMLKISVLERFTAPLCDAITDCRDGRAKLEEIERKGLFLIPLDPARQWFRFHHLFGDLLRSRLHQAEPDLVPSLHARASTWYAENGQTMEAASHSLAALDYDRAACLYERYAGGWWALGHPMFLDFLLKLPREVWARRPAFCTYHAWLNCITGQLEEAAALIETAGRQPALTDETRSFLAIMRSYIAELSGRAHDNAELDLGGLECIPEENASMRNTAEMMAAFIQQMNGRFEEAAALLVKAAGRDAAGRSTNAIPIAVPRLARIRLVQGRAAEAEDLCRRYLAIMQERGAARFYIRGNLHAVLADALRLQGNLDGAMAQAEEGVRCNSQWPIPVGIAMAAQALARVRLCLGDARGALELLDREEAAIGGRAIQPDLVSDRAAVRVQAWLALGDLESARRWAERSGLTPRDHLSFRRETEHIALARVLLATGRQSEGDALVSRLADAARAAGRLGRLDEIRRLKGRESPPAEPLSEREREILALLAEGYSNQEIADRLIVAVGTVKAHVHNIFRKLEVTGRTRLCARARELGLL
ncbi:MAG: LuxR C-terminal-related transcriptional regulator [Patescibacteria group bacterium]